MSRWQRRIEAGQISVNGAVVRDPEFVVRWGPAEGVTGSQPAPPTTQADDLIRGNVMPCMHPFCQVPVSVTIPPQTLEGAPST